MPTTRKPVSSYPVEVGGTITIRVRPDEIAYPLRRDEFDALMEGEPLAEEKRWRDIALASAVAFFVGLLGTIDVIDWGQVWIARQWGHLLLVAAIGAGTTGWLVVLGVQHNRIRRIRDCSVFTRVKTTIEAFFEENTKDGVARHE